MKIIIIGCGKVGATLAEQLSKEENSVTVIDRKYDVVQSLSNELDVIGLVGNGASYLTQVEAGIEGGDLGIARAQSDDRSYRIG